MSLYLDEAKLAIVPSDQVDFSVLAFRAEILGHNSIAQAAKVEIRFRLAPLRSRQMHRQGSTKQPGRLSQSSGNELGQPHHGLSGGCINVAQKISRPGALMR